MTRKLIARMAFAATLAASFVVASAQDAYMAQVRTYVMKSVQAWSRDPAIIAAILSQNAANKGLTEADIATLDAAWQAGFKGGKRQMIDHVLENTVSRFLKVRQNESRGVISEVFVMDNRGLIVGGSEATSDYWQGDEAKFQKTFAAGPDALFIDAVEKDDSTQALQSQASLTISDEAGRPIGAITVGINLDAL